MQRRLLLQAGTAAAAFAATPLLRAQGWPSGPIRIVVGFRRAVAPTHLPAWSATGCRRCGSSPS
jgi:hypothetical protein